MPRPKLDESERMVVRTLRVTQLQDKRLARLCALDSLPVQEHIRRAVDGYLGVMEAQRSLPALVHAPADASHAPSDPANVNH